MRNLTVTLEVKRSDCVVGRSTIVGIEPTFLTRKVRVRPLDYIEVTNILRRPDHTGLNIATVLVGKQMQAHI